MPPRVEMRMRYRNDREYRIDALAMERRGWRVQVVSTREVPSGFLRRLVTGGRGRIERDVRYLRETWEV